MCQLLCSETDFAQPMLRFSLCRLSTGPWAINLCVSVCMYHACVWWRILFGCSTGPQRTVKAWLLLQHLSAKHRECPASSNFFSSTLHSSLTRITTSAQSMLFHGSSHLCCSASHSQMLHCCFRVSFVYISYLYHFLTKFIFSYKEKNTEETFKCKAKFVNDT